MTVIVAACRARSTGKSARTPGSLFLRRRFRTALLTLGAQAFEMDGIVQNLEGGVAEIGRREFLQTGVIDVLDVVTAPADQVVMMIGVAVESSRRFKVIGAPRQAQLHECFQRPIDRRPRYPRHAHFDVLEKLIHGRMIVPVKQRIENHPTLDRNRQIALARDRL